MIKGTRILGMVFPRGKIRLSHVCIGLLYRYLTLREMSGTKKKQRRNNFFYKLSEARVCKMFCQIKKSKIFEGNQYT